MQARVNKKPSILSILKVMKFHGFNPSINDLDSMIKHADKSSTGSIDFNEFIEMMLKNSEDANEDVAHAFKVFDIDGDGMISAEELKLTMNNLGEPLTNAEVNVMIEAADLDGDGKINFKEFQGLMERKNF